MSSNTSSDNIKMSSAKTSKKTVTKTAEVAAPVAAPAPVKAEKATKAKTAKVAEVAAPVAAAAAPVVAATPVVAAEEDVSATLIKSISELHDQLSNIKSAISTATNALKTIEKQAARVVKKADRRRRRKTDGDASAEPKPCIFTKPVKVSDELCAFLGQAKGTEVSRSAVTKGVMAYARSHNLMDKQTIKADAALRKLLTLTDGDELTILNLQKFLRRHYIKAAPVAN
jgi:chromatin remodeling complex protein RSC6